MRERNIEVLVVNDGDKARKMVLERLPEGAEVHSGKSKTLQDAGIFDAIQAPTIPHFTLGGKQACPQALHPKGVKVGKT